ncbi:MAG: hypothetical protein IT196_26555 [Acidimicrobiales bacterium]|nr:hypothetical protein [Acidimicrobiales bacterium]
MKALVIYESMGGNTRRAAELIGGAAQFLGAETEVCSVTAVDLHQLAQADLVFMGSWTDGLFFAGQRPGRVGRFKKLPWLDGKHVSVFCTYAVNPGNTVGGLAKVLAGKGAVIVGGKAIKRNQIDNAHVAPFVADQFEALVQAAG